MKQVKKQLISKITNHRYRPHYHITTPGGWLNDPNGLCYFKGYYHVFYQYHPYSAKWGPMHWGHVRSRDLIHWEQLPVALVLGDAEDRGGCFSGSAIVKGDRLYLIYTGQHYYADHKLDHFWENQNIAYSDDGINFVKYAGNPVIETPNDNSQDFRDPKVWQVNNNYYLVLAGRTKETQQARILLYQSTDLLHWRSLGTIAHATNCQRDGSVWECPDLFKINDEDVFVCSPMGIQQRDHDFMNLSQVCYSVGHLDYAQPRFTGSAFREIDRGHNFYAAQTFVSPDQRRIMLGWLSPFDGPVVEQGDGWAGQLTLPRELTLKNNHLCNQPVREINQLRQTVEIDQQLPATGKQQLPLSDPQHADLSFSFSATPTIFTWRMRDEAGTIIKLTCDKGKIILYRRGDDCYRYAKLEGPLTNVRIIVDTSCVEIFINDGWVSLTELYFTEKQVNHDVAIDGGQGTVQAYPLRLANLKD